MCFEYLILGHLLGDFTFQTDKIAENKTRQWKWNLYHSIIVTFCMLISALPFGYLVIGLVIINGALHFAIDYYKSKLPYRSPLYSLIYFLADQSLHVSIIYLISTFYKGNAYFLPLNKEMTGLLIIFALISSFASILIQYILRLIFVSHSKDFFIKNEKNAGILTRILIFLSLYYSRLTTEFILLIIAAALLAKVFYYYRKWYPLMTPAYFYLGILIDFLVPFLAFGYISA